MSKRIFIIKICTVNGWLGEEAEEEIKKFMEQLSKKYTEDEVNPVYVKVMEI